MSNGSSVNISNRSSWGKAAIYLTPLLPPAGGFAFGTPDAGLFAGIAATCVLVAFVREDIRQDE